MALRYPNLELLEYKARLLFEKDEDAKAKVKEIENKKKALGKDRYTIRPEFDAIVFSQMWGSTSTGFGGFGGSAMTTEYTTIMREVNTNFYYVFFGSQFCYRVGEPTEQFYTDLRERNLKSMQEAEKVY
jgi:hypothetical protein